MLWPPCKFMTRWALWLVFSWIIIGRSYAQQTPIHHLCFDTCTTQDQYGSMNAALKNGITCNSGQGLTFDGVNDFVQLDAVPLGGATTFASWFRFDNVGGSTSFSRLFEFGNSPTAMNVQAFAVNTGSTLKVEMRNTGGALLNKEIPGFLVNGALTHFAWSISATGDFKVYKNGVEVGTKTGGGWPLPTATRSTNWIGKCLYGSCLWKGGMRSFSIYNRVLSAADVLALYNSGAGNKCSVLSASTAYTPQPPGSFEHIPRQCLTHPTRKRRCEDGVHLL